MFRDDKSQNKFYKVACANMEIMVLDETPQEAVANALKLLLNKFGENTNLSLIMSVSEIRDDVNEMTIFYTISVLENIGFFKLAKDLEDLSDFFLDKGKNSY